MVHVGGSIGFGVRFRVQRTRPTFQPLFWLKVHTIASVARDFHGRQLLSVKSHPEKLEVSRSYTTLFKGT